MGDGCTTGCRGRHRCSYHEGFSDSLDLLEDEIQSGALRLTELALSVVGAARAYLADAEAGGPFLAGGCGACSRCRLDRALNEWDSAS